MDLVLQEFLIGDASSIEMRNHYLSMARNVLGGNHDSLEISSDAFHVRISLDSVAIKSLWNDSAEPATISLNQFIELMSK